MISEDLDFNEEKELKLLSQLAATNNQIDWKPVILLSETYIEKWTKIKLNQIVKNRKINPKTLCRRSINNGYATHIT